MASYMPQHVFDIAVVTAIKIHMKAGDPLGQVCGQIYSQYQNSFPDDAGWEREVEETSQQLLRMMCSQFKDEQMPSAMTQLQFCMTTYEIDGS